MTSQLFAAQAGEGQPVRTPAGDTAVVKVDTEQTDGSMTVVELRIAPGSSQAAAHNSGQLVDPAALDSYFAADLRVEADRDAAGTHIGPLQP